MIKIFALNDSKDFGREVCKHLDVSLTQHKECFFDDGECYTSSLQNVRGCDAFILCSPHSDENESCNDKLIKLLIFAGSLRDASVKRVTLCMRYLPFCRQDRKTESRAPITTKYLARWFKSMWIDRILSIDVHNPTAIQNAHHIPVDLLEANHLFCNQIEKLVEPDMKNRLVVFSPDSGGLGRARKFRGGLSRTLETEVGLACLDKVHNGFDIKGHGIMGDVRGKVAIVYDDLISSGKTILECVEALTKHGVEQILAVCATHGLFVGKANEYLAHEKLKNIIITDTIKPFRLTNPAIQQKLRIIKTANLFAEAIRRIHSHESITDLINNHPLK